MIIGLGNSKKKKKKTVKGDTQEVRDSAESHGTEY